MATADIVKVCPQKDSIDCDSSNKTVETQPGGNKTIEEEAVAVEETELAVQDANVTSQPQPEIELPTENDDVEEMQTETSTNDVVIEEKEEALPDDVENIPLEDLQVVDEIKDREMDVDKQNVEEGKEEKERLTHIIYPLSEQDLATPEFEKIMLLSFRLKSIFRACCDTGRFNNTNKGAFLIKVPSGENYLKVQALVNNLTCMDGTKPKMVHCPPQQGVFKEVVEIASREFPVGEGGEETVSVFVNNLPKNAGQEVLHFLFPTALSVQLPVVMESAIQGYAIVEFASLQEARYMIRRNKRYPSKIGENSLRLHVIGHDEAKESHNKLDRQAKRGNRNEKTNKDSTQSPYAKVSPLNRKDVKVVGEKRKPAQLFPPAKKMKTDGQKELPQSGNKQNAAQKKKKDASQKESAQSGNKQNKNQKTGQVMPPKNENRGLTKSQKNKQRKRRKRFATLQGTPSGKPITNKGQDSNRAPVQRNSAGNKPDTSLQKKKANVQGSNNSRNSSFGGPQQRKRPLPVQSSNNNRTRRRSSSSLPMNSSMQNIGYSSGSQPLRPNYNSISPNFVSSEQLRRYQQGISGFPVDIGQRNLGLPGPYNTGSPRTNNSRSSLPQTDNRTIGSYFPETPRSYNTGTRGAYRSVSPPPYYNTGNVVDPYNRGAVEPYVSPRTLDIGRARSSLHNPESQVSSYDAGIQRSFSDAETRRSFADAETRRSSFDAGIQRPYTDAETRRSSYDTETRRSFSDAETRRSSFDAGIQRSFSDAETVRPSYDAGIQQVPYNTGTQSSSYNTGTQELSYSRPTILAGDPYSTPSSGRTEIPYNTGSGVSTLDYNRAQTSSSEPMADSYSREAHYIPRSPQATQVHTSQSYQNPSSYSNLKSNHYPANTDFKKPANYSRARNSSDTSPRTSSFQAPITPLNDALQSVASGTADAAQLRKLIQQLDQYERTLSGGDKTKQRNSRQQEPSRDKARTGEEFLVKMRFCRLSSGIIKTFVNDKLVKAGLCRGIPVRHVRKVSERDNDNAVVLQFNRKMEALAAVNLLDGTVDRGSVLSLELLSDRQR